MSLLDGKVVLEGERIPNRNEDRNRNNRQERHNRDDKQDRGGFHRGYENSKYYSFSHSSYLPDIAPEEDADVDEPDNRGKEDKDRRADAIYDFVEEFTSTQDFRQLTDIMVEMLPEALRNIRSYYNPNNSKMFVDAVNRLVNVTGTSMFSKALSKVLEGRYWEEDGTYDRIWRNIAFLLSIALETAYERMHTNVVRKYATEILPRLWKAEITEITIETGVTKDLALDLIIAIPMVGAEWNGSNIDAFYERFLDKMLIHAEDNMDILNWEVQGMLYDRFFGSKKGKTSLKVIGKFLTSAPRKDSELDGEVVQAVYKEFIKMLYKKLDNYDIKDIVFVFQFVANFRKENPDAAMIFNSSQATEYENVRKGLLQTMENDKDNMKYLA